jgi:hypothetical protein
MSDERKKVKDMIRKALDERTPEKERIVTAMKAIAFIEKHKLLDSPLDGLLDEETTDLIRSGEQFFRGAKKIIDRRRRG